MKITNFKNIKDKDLIVFDLDGTLAETKTPMDREMVKIIEQLLAEKKVAVIGGGKYDLFKEQLLQPLKSVDKKLIKNLSLFPTTSTSFYRYNRGWKQVYAHNLSELEVAQIIKAFEKVFQDINYQHPKKTYGEVIENRGTQVTFSALGQDVVKVLGKKGIALKNKWRDENTVLKIAIAKAVAKYLPNLEVRYAGHTSIDVTKKGIDKAYGLKQIEKYLKIKIKNMLFVGDAIFPGGNDYAVVKTGVDYCSVQNPEDTKKILRYILEQK